MEKNVSDGLLARIERLEKDGRHWKAGVLCLAALLAAAVLIGATDNPQEATLKKLTIVNSSGDSVVVLGSDGHGKAIMTFRDPEGKLFMELGTQLGPHLWMQGADGQSSVQVGVWKWEEADKEVPSLRFSDTKGEERVKLGYDLDFKAGLEICCKAGRIVALSGD